MNKNLFKKWKNISVFCLSIMPIIVIIFISFWWSGYNDTIILKKVKLSKTNVLDNSIYLKLLNQYIGQDIASINLKEVSYKIEKHPYVKAVRVSKRFPNKIMVEIVERTPVAILQIDPMLLLDEDGVVYYNSSIDISGFQFTIEGTTSAGAAGSVGAAAHGLD